MKTKRLLALLLAVAMMFTMLPTAAFAAVYTITGPDVTDPRYTVEFYAGNGMDGDPYETQLVKDGDSLVRPETPPILTGYNEFDGWYIGGSQSNGVWTGGDEVQFGPVTEEWLEANATNGVIQIHARFLNAIHVTFYDARTFDDEGKPTGNIVTTRSMTGGSIDLNSVTAESGELNMVFDQWVDANGNAVSTPYTATEDTSLYATFVKGYSLVFDANGDGASNTATQYLKENEVTRAPATPARPGYTFQDWYTAASGGTQFTFGNTLAENTTVYAHWTAATAKYTVIYWYENADDDGYSYAGATTDTIATGSTITSSSFQNTSFTGRDSTHFTYNSAKAESQVVAGDGSTVLNVYFTRNTYTLTFKSGNGKGATTYGTITAKYQAYIGDQWPTAGTKMAGNNTAVPNNLTGWSVTPVGSSQDITQATKVYTMTDQYCSSNGLTLTASTNNQTTNYTVNYMMESLDGTNGTYYNGKYYQNDSRYTQQMTYNQNTQNWSAKQIDGFTAVTSNVNVNNNAFTLYYNRNRNNITFYDNHGTTVASISDVMFEMPLSNVKYNTTAIKDIVPACPNALDSQYYTFDGWYTTPGCYDGTEANFDGTMPNAPLSFYAKWTPATFTVTYDANGGAFTDAQGNKSENISLTVNYGEKLTNVPTPYNEGYLFLGWADEDGNAWNFDTTITEDVTLYAQWHTDHVLNIVYNVDGNLTQVSDPNHYDDGATAIVRPYGTSGARFVGWSLDNDSSSYSGLYQPGDEIEVSSATDHADGKADYTVTLYAVFAEPLTTSITFDANGGAFSDNSTEFVKTIENNEGVDLDTIAEPTRTDYAFLGWATTSDATTAAYTADGEEGSEEIAADIPEKGKKNILYAVWAEAFYVYHSSDNSIVTYPVVDSFDITSLVKTGYIYGGYYRDYGNIEAGETVQPYTTDTIGTYWNETNWPWDKTEAYSKANGDPSGKIMEPVAGETYYLKEVPAEYLQPKNYYTYISYGKGYGDEGTLKAIYLLTAVDDPNYNTVGFCIGASGTSAGLYKTVTVTKDGSSITYKAKHINNVMAGLLGVIPYSLTSFAFTPYFITFDGVTIYGTSTRTVTIGNKIYYQSTASTIPDPDSEGGTMANPGLQISTTSRSSDLPDDLSNNSSEGEAAPISVASAYMLDWDDEPSVIDPVEPEKPDVSEATEVTITTVIDGRRTEWPADAGDCTNVVPDPSGDLDGEVFVGWFTDEDYTEPADFNDVQEDMTIYAKYVPAKSVRLNVTTSKGRGGVVNVTASLSLPGVEVAEVGFRTDDGDELADAYKGSSYRAAWTTSASSSTVTVTPYWVTLDGTMVYGEPGTYRVRTNSSSLWGF